ncbi:serine/threonine protein kinase [Pseudenhygromyxa sp. WMMC2535]|uniref:serine/threonine-protein kinase n=1 Tax=Pseudenhygromyxa sp. WMMC2535 TaxID=2712867 RepID=UPI001558201D|nr:serine/threonine-protein kinase [Pseudenhygromyxa sp. WMMC2535]NVB43012.1 serine/threonine protein kinase [Pseudenhygromyxa sp. WMMC2535]
MSQRVAQRLFGEASKEHESAGPTTVGRYELRRKVGTGGMGVVYAAHDPKLDRVVAIKLLKRRKLSSHAHARMLREAKLLARLAHPNIVGIFEVGEQEEDLYLAMEYVEGQTLYAWQGAEDRSRQEILDAYCQAGAGLAAAHANGIIHRDFKPNNALMGADGRVRVVDFGLAIESGLDTNTPTPRTPAFSAPIDAPEQTLDEAHTGPPDDSPPPKLATAHLAGTPGYLAPELYAGEPADARSDQFAFCVSLWEALTGERPFSPRQLARQAKTQAPLPLPAAKISPPWLRRALIRGLSADPSQRWPSLEALLQALDPHSRRQRRLAAALLVGGSLLGLAFTPLFGERPSDPCEDPSARFDHVWSTKKSAAISARAADRAPAIAETTIERVEALRAEQREAWSAATLEQCEALRHSQDNTQTLHLQTQQCLERHLARAGIFAHTLELGERETFIELDQMIEVLGDPRACLEQTAARPTLAPELEALRSQLDEGLDEARMLLASGQVQRAQTLAIELAARAEPLGLRGSESAALAIQAKAALRQGLGPDAYAAAWRGYLVGLPAAEPEVLFELRMLLAEIQFLNPEEAARSREQAAARWRDQAAASFETLSERRQIQLLLFDANLAEEGGDFAAQERALRDAQDIAEGGHHQSQLETTRLQLIDIEAARGLEALCEDPEDHEQLDAALEDYASLLEEQRARLGARHPGLATVEFNMALTYLDLGDPQSAQPHFERALSAIEAAHGPRSVRLAADRVALAESYSMLGEPDASTSLAAAALIDDPTPDAHAPRADALRQLGWQAIQRWQLPLAFAIYDALARERASQLDASETQGIAETLGWLALQLGHHAQAQILLTRALGGPDASVALNARANLAQLALERGELAAATAQLLALREDPGFDEATAPATVGAIEAMLVRVDMARGESGPTLDARAARARALLLENDLGPLHTKILALPIPQPPPRE